MTMTLMDMASRSNIADWERDAILTYWEHSDIARMLPFKTTPTGTYKWRQRISLGDVDWRGYNENYLASEGQVIERILQTKFIGGVASVDAVLLEEARSAEAGDILADEIAAKMEAAARWFSKQFFDGDSAANPKAYDGLNALCTDTDGDKPNLLVAGTNGSALTVALLDQLVSAMPGRGGAPGSALLMGHEMRDVVTSLYRTEHGESLESREMWGMPVMMYRGVPIVVVGTDESDNEILGFDETQGNSDVCGSIYAVRFGANYMHGIQNFPMRSLDPEGNTAIERSITAGIEWKVAIAPKTPNSSVRLAGVLKS